MHIHMMTMQNRCKNVIPTIYVHGFGWIGVDEKLYAFLLFQNHSKTAKSVSYLTFTNFVFDILFNVE